MDGRARLAARVAAQGVRDERLLAALRQVSRADFVPAPAVHEAFDDRPLRIPHRQTTTQPSLSAMMIEALRLDGDEHVLEIGTGYGFQTALLAHLATRVWSVERYPDLVEVARRNLEQAGITNVVALAGDGTDGLPEAAPFDAVLVSAAFPEVPAPLIEQLVDGGRLVQPIGPGGAEEVMVFRKADGDLVAERVLTAARFVRLTGRHGYGR